MGIDSFNLTYVSLAVLSSTFHCQRMHSYLWLYRPDFNGFGLFNTVFNSQFLVPSPWYILIFGFMLPDFNGMFLSTQLKILFRLAGVVPQAAGTCVGGFTLIFFPLNSVSFVFIQLLPSWKKPNTGITIPKNFKALSLSLLTCYGSGRKKNLPSCEM